MSSPPTPPHVDPPEPGDPPEIGAYQVLGRLGEGGMGTVHLGRAEDGRLVAIKIVHEGLARDPEFHARFATEVQNAQRVASFCTAQVLGQGRIGGRPYMVTEFIDGDTLYQHVSRNGPLGPGTLHGVAVGVAAGLAAIHAAGLVHRDLKPANVILSVSGPRVIDFGIARALDMTTGATPTGFVVGSPGWIAPEQLLNRQVGTFADIFSWGCLIAYAGNGRHPYGRGNAITMAGRILHGEPDIGSVAPPLRDLVAQALSREPNDRPTALQLLLALVGGGSQNVQRAAVELVTTEWQAPAAAEIADAGPPEETPPNGGGTVEAERHGDRPPAARAWPEAPPSTAAPVSPWAGLDLGGDEPETAPSAWAPEVAAFDAPTVAPRQPPPASPVPPQDATVAPPPAPVPSGPPPETTDRPQVTPAPAPGAPATSRRTRLLVAALAVVVLLAGAGTYLFLRLKPGTGTTTFQPLPLGRTHPTDVGRPIRLGPADLTLGRPRCGPTSFRGRTAKGRFCLIPLIAFNNGDTGVDRTVRLSPTRLQLLDTGGGQRTPAAVVDGLRPGDTELPTGARTAGDLLFDVPRGADPLCIWLFTTEPGAAKRVKTWL